MFDLKDYVPEDKLEAAQAAYDADIAGLKNKITEKTQIETKLKADNAELSLQVETAGQKAVVAEAEKNGTGLDLKAAQDKLLSMEADHKTQLDGITADNLLKDNQRSIESSTNEFLKSFVQTPESQLYMKTKFQDSVEVVDGALKPKDASMTMEQLEQSFITGKDYAHNVIANIGSGGNALGATNTNVSDTGSKNEAAQAAIKSGDAIAHLNSVFKQTS